MIRRNLFLSAMLAVVLTLILFANVPANSAARDGSYAGGQRAGISDGYGAVYSGGSAGNWDDSGHVAIRNSDEGAASSAPTQDVLGLRF